ncbi:AI-2E family transporter [bacterium]|nr:AI-2E family transporter [bacterium]
MAIRSRRHQPPSGRPCRDPCRSSGVGSDLLAQIPGVARGIVLPALHPRPSTAISAGCDRGGVTVPSQLQGRYWTIAAVLFFVALWYLGSVMLPFLVGGALAYFLDPLADRLERLGLSRVAATSLITLAAFLLVVLLVLAVIPVLVQQLAALINAAPEISSKLQAFLVSRFPELTDSTSVMRTTLADIAQAIQARGGALAQGLLASVFSVVGWLLFIVVVPVVAFYLLMDWDQMVARVDDLLPRDHAPVIRMLAREIDTALAGFVRGQVTVCILLAVYYASGLMLAGLQFGLIIGAIAGAITVIPYFGAMTGGALAIGLAFYQFWGDWIAIGIIAAIFGFGQFMEGNVLTPRLVGKSIGVHPVWLIFALSVFGGLFGIAGMLVAVPLSATLGVLARFGVSKYKESLLYLGETQGPDQDGGED